MTGLRRLWHAWLSWSGGGTPESAGIHRHPACGTAMTERRVRVRRQYPRRVERTWTRRYYCWWCNVTDFDNPPYGWEGSREWVEDR